MMVLSRSDLKRTAIVPPAAVWRSAFSSRLKKTRCSCSLLAETESAGSTSSVSVISRSCARTVRSSMSYCNTGWSGTRCCTDAKASWPASRASVNNERHRLIRRSTAPRLLVRISRYSWTFRVFRNATSRLPYKAVNGV